LPPLVRPLPHVDELSLYRAEESNDERSARQTVGVVTVQDSQPTPQTDVDHRSTILHLGQQEEQNVSSGLSPASNMVSVQSTSKAPLDIPPLPPSQNFTTPQFSPAISSNISPVPPFPNTSGHVPSSATTPHMNALGDYSKSAGAVAPAKPSSMDVDDDEDDQELPTIDVESDSDHES